MTPPPMMTARPLTSADAPAERIALVDQQRALGGNVGGARDHRRNAPGRAVDPAIGGAKAAADDALLDPARTFGELAIGGEAGELGAGAGAARRAVVGFAGAEDEIAGVGAGLG